MEMKSKIGFWSSDCYVATAVYSYTMNWFNIQLLVFRILSKELQNEKLVHEEVSGVGGQNSCISSNSIQCNKAFVFSSWGHK